MLASSALVLLMTPGLAFFYGGMVRTKSVLNMMMMSMATVGIVSIIWVIYGFELAFGVDGKSPWYGAIKISDLGNQVGAVANNGGEYPIPLLVFAAFQLMFAIITPALISGAIADRAKFVPWTIFVAIWTTVVYLPVAHWVFAFGNKVGDVVTGAGYLAAKGVEDFAGGTAVHINAGAAGLALAIVLGKRIGWRKESMRPHSLPLVMLGAGLLWFGWFGFNAGSALGANGIAGLAFLNTQVAAAAALIGWIFVEKVRNGHATTLGAASGVVSGLVAITPACAFVAPWAAVVIGFLAGVICSVAVGLKYLFNFDDSLDVVGVHLVGGIFGSLSIGFFGSSAVNSIGLDGLFYGGGAALLGKQALAVAMVAGYSFFATLIIGLAIEKTIGFRVTKESELEGVDFNEHAESAYEMSGSTRGGSLI
ncbi:MAG: ammonium transporter [Actinobacteria bacterium]|nr:ammonium transporter [Actinomycetota bacterium]